MSKSFGEQPEPWMNSEAHNRHSSRKKIKKERHRKLRNLPLEEDARTYSKIYSGWEW